MVLQKQESMDEIILRYQDQFSLTSIINYIKQLNKDCFNDALKKARQDEKLLIQPRAGEGGHQGMLSLINKLSKSGVADLLPVTIDAYTRLLDFTTPAFLKETNPDMLNGYPLVSHGFLKGREINESTTLPIEVRHGSPDGRELFLIALASGFTSYEGGGISYLIPYSYEIPMEQSLRYWNEIDRLGGKLAEHGIIVDRETFGSLSGGPIPPSIMLAISLLEAMMAVNNGIKCISFSYGQGGNLAQDIAALRLIPKLADRYLSDTVEIFPVLHEWMGVFPERKVDAMALILYGAVTAKMGGATKIITKSPLEAFGIPSAKSNIEGMRVAKLATSELYSFEEPDSEIIEMEEEQILEEVMVMIDPILQGNNLNDSIVSAFKSGKLDVPFCPSIYTRNEVIPSRDESGAIRILAPGKLPFTKKIIDFNNKKLNSKNEGSRFHKLIEDIYYMAGSKESKRNPFGSLKRIRKRLTSKKNTIVIGVSKSDVHVMPNLLTHQLLDELGFQVINLGACTTVDEFVSAYANNQNVKAIIISSLNGHALKDLEGFNKEKKKYNIICPVFLFGNLSVGSIKPNDLVSKFNLLGIDYVNISPEVFIETLNNISR